jgi:hypothetical protein
MRIDEVVRVQNPMGGNYKSQLDRDRAAAAVRAQRQANREMPNRGAVSGAKSGTDPQGGMFTPGAVTTKSYNNALTKQFARPAGQGKGIDIMGNPLKQPAQRKIEPAIQTPQQPTTASTTPNWVGQNTNVPAVQRKQQAQTQTTSCNMKNNCNNLLHNNLLHNNQLNLRHRQRRLLEPAHPQLHLLIHRLLKLLGRFKVLNKK